ncbi:DUF433 domain-containing protein [Actinoallomurus sp. CA-142502]|uniref:DUF433 domain-containing protein n=1 Tax=Actinoallomurus sp. CA-142502 TaxID=3239885 RepID=UPI003D8CF0B5
MTSVLDREMYSEAEAARLLGVHQSTLHYWLEGGQSRGKTYRPIIREAPRGVRTVTWAEFVEAGFLREYRNRKVPMLELRKFVDELRDTFGVPYPLADRRPFVSGRRLVYQAQVSAGLNPEYCLVSFIDDQLMLTPPAETFVDRVEWVDNVAAQWRPDDNPRSPVRVNPDIRFGRPNIEGISTEAIWEQIEAGENVSTVADTYDLTVPQVRWALSYENSVRAA